MVDDMIEPFILSLMGGILHLILSAFPMLVRYHFFGGTLLGVAMSDIFLAVGIWNLIVAALIIIGSLFMRNPGKARIGSIIVLVFGIIGSITGLFTGSESIISVIGAIGSLLAIIGGALGISKVI